MKSALHGDDRYAAQFPAKEPAAMPDGCRLQKVWHIAVIDRGIEFNRFADGAQTRAENDSTPGLVVPTAADVCGGFVDLGAKVLHSDTYLPRRAQRIRRTIFTLC